MKSIGSLVILVALAVSASGCISGANIDLNIATGATCVQKVQPNTVNTFALCHFSNISGSDLDPDAAALVHSMPEQDRKLIMLMNPAKAAFVENLARDYLVLKGYKEVAPADQPDIVVTASYVDGFAERDTMPQIVMTSRYLPAEAVQPGANAGAEIWTGDLAAMPAHKEVDHCTLVIVTLWSPGRVDPAMVWQGRAATDEASKFGEDSIDLTWATLGRFYERTPVVRGSLNSDLSDQGSGVLLYDLYKGGSAYKNGLREGDALVSIDDLTFVDYSDVDAYCAARAAGTPVTVKVLRKGSPLVKSVPLGKRILTDVVDY